MNIASSRGIMSESVHADIELFKKRHIFYMKITDNIPAFKIMSNSVFSSE